MGTKAFLSRNRWVLSGVALGLLYGLAMRIAVRFHVWDNGIAVMTWGFVFGVPLVVGFLTVFVAERERRLPVWKWFLLPWLPVIGMALGTLVMLFEGRICIAMFLPVGMVCASIGGVAAGILGRLSGHSRANDVVAGCVLLLPMLISPWESRVLYSKEIRDTETFIDITAPPSSIWTNIERVAAIQPAELPNSWSHRIGFPNPIEATLSYEGIGGIRDATFSGGVLFIETIDEWRPEQRLGFSIKAQTDQIPNTTLDEHVRIGGSFFDVLHGEYTLESLGNGVTRLHLSSQHRVSTDFNWYARIWTNAIMADLQTRILHVIKDRCERESRSSLE